MICVDNVFIVLLLFYSFLLLNYFCIQGLYFVGQYAAPVTCLEEMKTWNIAGVTSETMGSEAERFYEIVSQLMTNAVPDQAPYCEFIYFDGR